jgi:PleD family two-component response regulator
LLVVDLPDGPAAIFADTISRLLNREVAVTFLTGQSETLNALSCSSFDLALVGVRQDPRNQLSLVRYMNIRCADLPILMVSEEFDSTLQERARRFGAQELVGLPRRARELKLTVEQIEQRYLNGL